MERLTGKLTRSSRHNHKVNFNYYTVIQGFFMAFDPSVIKDGYIYRMVFSAGATDDVKTIVYCDSIDAKNWSNYRVILTVPGTDPGYPCLLKDGATYKLWVADLSTDKIVCYETTDPELKNLSSLTDCISHGDIGFSNVDKLNCPFVLKDASLYKMWFLLDTTSPNQRRVACAESNDGTNWTNFQIVLSPNDNSSADDDDAVGPVSVIKESNGTYRIWYCGRDSSGDIRVFSCISPTGVGSWSNFDIAIDFISPPFQAGGIFAGYHENQIEDIFVMNDNGVARMWFSIAQDNWLSDKSIGYCEFGTVTASRPQPTLSTTAPATIDTHEFDVSIDFNEDVSGFTDTDLSVTNGTVTNLSMINSASYVTTVALSGSSGNVTVNLSPDCVTDQFGNGNDPAGFVHEYEVPLPVAVTFQGHQVVISYNDYSGAGEGAYGPYVLKEHNLYKMWYTGRDSADESYIIFCESDNGINWFNFQTLFAKDNVAEDNKHVSMPCVFYNKGAGIYKMWYTGEQPVGVHHRIYCDSKDGITWSNFQHLSTLDPDAFGGGMDQRGGTGSHVIKDYTTGTYHMWYVPVLIIAGIKE